MLTSETKLMIRNRPCFSVIVESFRNRISEIGSIDNKLSNLYDSASSADLPDF